MNNPFINLKSLAATALLALGLIPGTAPCAGQESGDEAHYRELAGNLVSRLPKDAPEIKLCVLLFTPYGDNKDQLPPAQLISGEVESALSSCPKVTIITRTKLEDLENEANFQMTDLVEDSDTNGQMAVSAVSAIVRGAYGVVNGRFIIMAEIVNLNGGAIIKETVSWEFSADSVKKVLPLDELLASYDSYIANMPGGKAGLAREFRQRLELLKDGSLGPGEYPFVANAVRVWFAAYKDKPVPPKWIDILLKAGCDVDMEDSQMMTPLGYAATTGQTATMQKLLDSGADANRACTREKLSPLFLSLRRIQHDAALLLLNKGANPNTPDKEGLTPLHLAANKAMADVCELMLQRNANPKAATDDKMTPLHSLMNYNPDIRSFFGKRVVESPDGQFKGDEAEYGAQDKLRLPICKMLVDAGCDVNAAAANGNTALTMAEDRDFTQIAAFLLSHGAKKIPHQKPKSQEEEMEDRINAIRGSLLNSQ